MSQWYSDWAHANCDPDDDDYVPSCEGETRGKYACSNPALWYHDGHFYCKRHAPEGANKIDDKQGRKAVEA